MNTVPIRSLVERTKQRDPEKLGCDSITYVDISSIDRQSKRITNPQVLAVKEAPSRARKLIHAEDVLVSTVRPNLNSVALVSDEYHNEIASTGFCVLRAKKDCLVSRYLFYFTQTSGFVSHLTKLSIGAGYPAVSDDTILDMEIPLPPLPEQKHIAAVLAKADRLRRLRRTARHLSDTYLQSVFLEMFGDPMTNPMGWERATIGEVVASSQYGTSKKSNADQRGYPVLGMGNVTYSGRIELTSLSYVELSEEEFERLRLVPGDIIFNRTNSTELVGKTSHWNYKFDAVLASYLVKLKLKKSVLPDYYATLLNTGYYKRLFQERCKKAVGQSNISPTLLKEFPILIPSLPLQQQFARIVNKFERLRAQQREAQRQAEHLFQTLLHRAFRGEL